MNSAANQISVIDIDGDLITCDADIIVQQCNCLTKTAHGLSQTIKDAFNVDPYGHRRLMPRKKNCAIKEDWGRPGKTILYDRFPEYEDGGMSINKNPRFVACLFAQFGPGKPGIYHQELLKGETDPISQDPLTDSKKQREDWFKVALDELSDIVKELPLTEGKNGKWKIAFPFMIGCGLAGGDWKVYKQMIENWTISNDFNRNIVEVFIIHKK
jgi:hypothetical protein